MSEWMPITEYPSCEGEYKVVINERGRESISVAIWNGEKWNKNNIEMWKNDKKIVKPHSTAHDKYLRLKSQLHPPDGKL